MMLLVLAWRNMWRNRNRTLITMASVFFAVLLAIIMQSLQTGVFENLIKNVVSFYSGYVQIHKAGYWNEQVLDNAFILDDSLTQQLQSNKNISGFTTRLESFVLASSGEKTQGCMIVGVVPEKEISIIHLNEKVSKGNYFKSNDRSVMIGEGLADKLELKLNDTILLLGQGYHGATAAGKYHIKALLKFAAPDLNDRILFIPLGEAQNLFGSERLATSVLLQPQNIDELTLVKNNLQQSIGKEYEVMTWQDMMPDVVQHMQMENAGTIIFFGILLLLVSFGIFGTLLMMVAERQYEFGMLIAIGMKRMQLGIVLVIESVLVTLSGSILGVFISIPIVLYLSVYPFRFGGELGKMYEKFGFEPIFPASTAPYVFYTQAIIVFIIGLLLSLYPAIKILRLNPTKAMRK